MRKLSLKNPELHSFEAGVGAAKGGVRTARTFSKSRVERCARRQAPVRAGRFARGFHGNFELTQLFQFPGKRALKVAIAEKNVEVQKLALEGFRFALAAKVRRSFYELLAAQKVTVYATNKWGLQRLLSNRRGSVPRADMRQTSKE